MIWSRSFSKFPGIVFAAPAAVLLLLACDDTTSVPRTSKWPIKPGVMNVGILVSDYRSYDFEAGVLRYYPACDGCDDQGLPFEVRYRPPGDFGDITFRYTETGDTVFYASIIWMGMGEISIPPKFYPASEFETVCTAPRTPLSIEYFNIMPKMDTAVFQELADSAWSRVRNLDIVDMFATGDYRVGIYLYPPSVGVFNPAPAKWIIFLCRQKGFPSP